MHTAIKDWAQWPPIQLDSTVLEGLLALAAVYTLVLRPVVYNLFFSPLREYPGPKLWAVSRIPLCISHISGQHHKILLRLHCQYGDVIRISPDELSYVRPDSWKDIMGHRKKGVPENTKDPVFYRPNQQSILGGDRELHAQSRRILSHGFSAKSMLEQEGIIQHYIDLLFRRMKTKAAEGEVVDIVRWYNFTTFDIIGDLAFGESFGCLATGNMHPWVANIFDNLKQNTFLINARRFLWRVDELIQAFVPSAVAAMKKHNDYTSSQVEKRLRLSQPRPDFMESMLTKDGGAGAQLSRGNIEANSSVLVVAGSETTATVLSFATYLLCTHPQVLARLRAEIDANFKSEGEINFTEVSQLSYMLAVLNEAMRMYPAVPHTLPRCTPPEGALICGRFVPGNTTLGVPQWTAYHYPDNFDMADRFIPERWLPEENPFPGDKKDIFNPFSHGGRDCIGKNLAYTEMRVILARMIFCFDIALDPDSGSWAEDMPAYVFWEKPPMNVHLRLRPGRAVA
jgi:cytochrome P450